jgi:hypothetical protein
VLVALKVVIRVYGSAVVTRGGCVIVEIIKHGWSRELICFWCRAELLVVLTDLRKLLHEEQYVFKCIVCGMKCLVSNELVPANAGKLAISLSVEYGAYYPQCEELPVRSRVVSDDE